MSEHSPKVLVAFHPSPYSRKLISFAKAIAQSYGRDLVAVYIKGQKKLSELELEFLKTNEILARSLGAEIIILESEDILESLVWTCEKNQITHVVLGKSKKGFNSQSITEKLLKRCSHLDITTLSPDENVPQKHKEFVNEQTSFIERLKNTFKFSLVLPLIPFSVFVVLVLTGINYLLIGWVDYRSLGIIYILGINIGALYTSRFSITIAAILSSLAWNYLFIPPRFTLHIYSREDWIMELMFVVGALVIGRLSRQLKNKELFLIQEGNRKANLYQVLKVFSNVREIEKHMDLARDFINKLTGAQSDIFVIDENFTIDGILKNKNDDYRKIFQWVLDNKKAAGKMTVYFESSAFWFIPLQNDQRVMGVIVIDLKNVKHIDPNNITYIETVINQLLISLDRDRLFIENSRNKIIVESQKIMKSLLSSVSHELRTPLAAIKGFASTLVNSSKIAKDNISIESGEEIIKGVERLDLVVQNLLDMSRLESGYFKIKNEIVDVSELIFAVSSKVKKRFPDRLILINQPQDQVFTVGDFVLLQQSLENILSNACIYSDDEIYFNCKEEANMIIFEISDKGPGLIDTNKIFEKFYRERPHIPGGTGLGLAICKSFLDLHGGSVEARNQLKGGALFKVSLKKEVIGE